MNFSEPSFMFEKDLACIEAKEKKKYNQTTLKAKIKGLERKSKFFYWEEQRCLWSFKLFFVTSSIHV